jgi:hypothetical protein
MSKNRRQNMVGPGTKGVNAATLTGNVTLTQYSANFQVLNPNGTNRNVTLPALTKGRQRWFNIRNSGTSANLVIKNPDATTLVTLVPGASAMIAGTGAAYSYVSNTADLYVQALSTQGFIPLPLTNWREITSNDITNIAGIGGLLCTDTTPALETVNGDTDGQIRLLWAAANADPIATQVTLPPDLDRTAPIVVNIRGKMAASADTPVMDIDTFFDEGDTKVEDATAAFAATVGNKTGTIAAADIPSTANSMSIELTPGSHGTDTLAVYAIWLTYTKKLLAS